MNVTLSSEAEAWVLDEVASGRFASAEDVVRHAIDAEKRRRLRQELDAAEREGGAFTADDVIGYAHKHLDRLSETGSSPNR